MRDDKQCLLQCLCLRTDVNQKSYSTYATGIPLRVSFGCEAVKGHIHTVKVGH
jgi:hypothetical protein